MNNKDGLDAYWKEWTNLEAKGVYSYETLCEWSRVSREARDQGKEIHLGFLFGFMVQKGAEFEPGDPRQKYKYPVVLRGNDIKDQSFEVALFQEMATTPTTLEASRFCDLLGLLPGNATQGRDVEQAYLLAKMKAQRLMLCSQKNYGVTKCITCECQYYYWNGLYMGILTLGHSGTNTAPKYVLRQVFDCFRITGRAVIGTMIHVRCLSCMLTT